MNGRILSAVLIITMLLVVFLIQTNSRDSILIKETAYVCAGVLALLLTSAAILTGRQLRYGRIRKAWLVLLGCILLWMLVTHLTGVRSVNARFQFSSLASLAGLILASALFLDTRWRDRLISVLLGVTFLLAVYAVLQWRSVYIFTWDAAQGMSGRVAGLMGNPNLLGSFMATLIPLGICYLIQLGISRAYRTVLVILFTVPACLAIIASGTRGSLIGLAAGLVTVMVYTIVNRGLLSRRAWVLLSVALLLLLAGSLLLMAPRLAEMTSLNSGTVQVRKLIWSGSLDMLMARPLTGWGPGSFQIAFPEFRSPFYHTLGVSHNTLHAHGEYFEILTDTGIVGALLWLSLVVLLIREIRKRLPLTWTVVGLISALVATAVEATVSVSLRWPPTAWLAAFLAGMLLVSTEHEPVSPSGRWKVPAGIGAMIAALLLAVFAVPWYLSRMSAASQLFVGKDIYLNRIESEMGRAVSSAGVWRQSGDERYREDAVTWWMNAKATADSSISSCISASEADGDDLGVWYALGSAYLTKAILEHPQDFAVISALERSGIQAVNLENARDLTRRALAAYDSLIARAPNYAELHNNLALAYTRLGMLDETFASLRQSYRFFAHRRPDYVLQVSSLLSLQPLNRDGWHILWQETGDLFSTGRQVERESSEMLRGRLQVRLWLSGLCFYMAPASADSLYAAIDGLVSGLDPLLRERFLEALQSQLDGLDEDLALMDEYGAGMREGLLERASAGSDDPSRIYPVREYIRGSLLCEEGDMTGPGVLISYGENMMIRCRPFISHWPGGGDYLTTSIDCLLDAGLPQGSDSIFLQGVYQLLLMDVMLLTQCRLGLEDFVESADPVATSVLSGIWDHLGGPRNSNYYYDGAMPWSPGSLLERTAESLDLLTEANPGDYRYYLLQLRFYYLIFSSYWWYQPAFTDMQRNYAINSIVENRRMLTEILGADDATYVTGRAISEEYDRTRPAESHDMAISMESFRTDVIHDLVETVPMPE